MSLATPTGAPASTSAPTTTPPPTPERAPAHRAAASEPPISLAAQGWRAFTRLRRTRPFWGSLVLLAGAYFVARPVITTNFTMLNYLGVRGAQVYLLGGGMALAALVALITPRQRHFPALMAMGFSVASLPLANLGGWIVGMALGIVGSGLIFAWTPYTDEQVRRLTERDLARAQRRSERRALRRVRRSQPPAAGDEATGGDAPRLRVPRQRERESS